MPTAFGRRLEILSSSFHKPAIIGQEVRLRCSLVMDDQCIGSVTGHYFGRDTQNFLSPYIAVTWICPVAYACSIRKRFFLYQRFFCQVYLIVREITVLLHSRYGIRVAYGGHIFEAIRYLKPQNKNASTKVEKKIIKAVDPHLQLRHSSGEWKAIWWMEDYNLPEKNF